MRKLHFNIITKKHLYIIMLLVGVVCALFLLRSKQQTETIGSSRLFHEVILKALPELQARWELGDIEENFIKERFSCSEIIANSKLIGQEYLQCNRLYLECFLQSKAGNKESGFKIQVRGKVYKVLAQKNENNFYTSLAHDGQVKLNLLVSEIPGKLVAIKLQNTCADLFLPHGIYAAGVASENFDSWDNFGQNIYVDKYYVTNKDINEWIEVKKLSIPSIKEPMWFPFPATTLSEEDRRKYCAFRGKQLLDSRVLDAASFIPDEQATSSTKIYKSPYYWTKGKRESFLYNASQNKNYSLTDSDCNRAYVAGCQRKSLIVHFPNDGVSWMGMKYPLGFYPESVVNHYYPELNLAPSSFYFAADSLVHEIGYRAKWDGEGFSAKNLTFSDIDMKYMQNNQYEIAFRCMKVVSK